LQPSGLYDEHLKETAMPDPKVPVAPAAKAPVAAVANPPAAAPTTLAIDERFAALAADLMSQVEAKLETFRREIATQLGLNVDPLHKDLHDLLDMHAQLGIRVDRIAAKAGRGAPPRRSRRKSGR
jgi:hypothetical protein